MEKKVNKKSSLFLVIIIALLGVGVKSCLKNSNKTTHKNRASELESVISQLDQKCPIHIAEGVDLTGAKIKDNYVVSYYSFENAENPLFRNYKQYPEQMKKKILLGFVSTDLQRGEKQIEIYSENNYGVKHDLTTKNGEHFVLTITPENFENIKTYKLKPQKEVAKEMFKLEMEMQRSSLPYEEVEGVFIVKAEVNDQYFVRTYEVDEDMYNLDDMEKLLLEQKKEFMDQQNMELANQLTYMECKNCEIGYKEVYQGKQSGRKFEINYTAEEIDKAIQSDLVLQK